MPRLFPFPMLRLSLAIPLVLLFGCHTFEVRQSECATCGHKTSFSRVAVIMATQKTLEGDRTKQPNKLFTEQLIVSCQQHGLEVAERQKVESLLVDSDLVASGQADLTESERARRLGKLLKVDLIIYGDAIVNETNYQFFDRLFFNSDSERLQLETEANKSGVVKRNNYPVLAHHSIGLSLRAVNTSTGEIAWIGYRCLATAQWVKDEQPDTLSNFGVIQLVCDEMVAEILAQRG